MRPPLRHILIVLYLGLLGCGVVTVYILSVQSEKAASSRRYCNDDLTENCHYERDRRRFESAFEERKRLKLSFANKLVSAAALETSGRKTKPLPVKTSPDKTRIYKIQTTPKKPHREQTILQKHKTGQTLSDFSTQKVQNKKENKDKKQNAQGYVRNFPKLYQPSLIMRLNCTKVWLGEQKEISRVQSELTDIQAARRPPGFYSKITQDCEHYRKNTGYVQEVSEEEENFPLAFSLLVYKDVEQLERLLRAVYRPNNAYCVHVDIKATDGDFAAIQSLIKCLPNVIEAPRRVSVRWGKFTVLEPELICMEALLSMHTSTKWRYLINLTGQEFPLKTNKELVKILQLYRGANDIMGEPPKQRNSWRWEKAGSPPHNFSLAKGPVHMAASYGFVKFLMHSAQAHDLLAWAKNTSIPDETFFATLNNQHQIGVPGAYTGNLTSRRRIALNRWKVWDSSPNPCGGRFVRHICHFGLSDVPRLVKSRHFIANKFTYDYQPLGYDCLEQWYFDRVKRQENKDVTVDTRYYSNLEIVKYALRRNVN